MTDDFSSPTPRATAFRIGGAVVGAFVVLMIIAAIVRPDEVGRMLHAMMAAM